MRESGALIDCSWTLLPIQASLALQILSQVPGVPILCALWPGAQCDGHANGRCAFLRAARLPQFLQGGCGACEPLCARHPRISSRGAAGFGVWGATGVANPHQRICIPVAPGQLWPSLLTLLTYCHTRVIFWGLTAFK